jgi:hypothetical protein
MTTAHLVKKSFEQFVAESAGDGLVEGEHDHVVAVPGGGIDVVERFLQRENK